MEIQFIRDRFAQQKYRLTKHALQQKIDRNIVTEEIEQTIMSGEIIEEYPKDKYGPSALVFGKTGAGRPLHVLCSYSEVVWVITTYEPDIKEWIDGKVRRK